MGNTEKKVADKHLIIAKDLELEIKLIWTQKIVAEYCKYLVHSMPCRLKAVIKSKSKHIKY